MNLALELDDYEVNTEELSGEKKSLYSAQADIQRYFEKQNLNQEKIDYIIDKFSNFVYTTTMIEAISISYDLIKNNHFCDSNEQSQSSIPDDVRFVVGLIHKVQKIASQDFVGGLLVLHLIFIEGLKCDGLI
jgi:hypothetical protein